jgi:hypothetical protein
MEPLRHNYKGILKGFDDKTLKLIRGDTCERSLDSNLERQARHARTNKCVSTNSRSQLV